MLQCRCPLLYDALDRASGDSLSRLSHCSVSTEQEMVMINEVLDDYCIAAIHSALQFVYSDNIGEYLFYSNVLHYKY